MAKTLQHSTRWHEFGLRLKESFKGWDEPGYPFAAGFPEQVLDPSGVRLIFEIIDFNGDRFLASREGLSPFDPSPVWRVWKRGTARKEFLEVVFVAAWRELPPKSPKS